ncbi:hypothetical protein GCM10022252_75460 [Streptosporangium oxazolinicum]|uniref:HNH endonuclease n=1 Tax=Streptosporangium oxazolinicum TaxID=909287 RepID=A0ABP8BKU6_9ACTN
MNAPSNGLNGRDWDRHDEDGTGISTPCAEGRHTGCQDLRCACPNCTQHAAARQAPK